MQFPPELKYSKDHEWIKVENDHAFVGITEFAQGELGDIVFVEVNTVGQNLSQSSLFGTIEAVKTVSDLFIPVSGKILEFNPSINANAEIINADPYEKGWIVKISITEPKELDSLMTADEYAKMVGH